MRVAYFKGFCFLYGNILNPLSPGYFYKCNNKTDIFVKGCMQKKKFIEMIETLEQHEPAIIGLNYDYNRNEETGRTSVTLNGLMVAIVSRTDTPDLFKVNMVNIATDSIEIIGRDEAKKWIDRQVTRFLFGCYKKISL